MEREREQSKNPTALQAEEEAGLMLLRSLEGRRAPLPPKAPSPNVLDDGWSTLDITFDVSLRDCFGDDESPSISSWPLNCPDVRRLHVVIGQKASLKGLGTAFPNTAALVVDDSNECLRICYDLSPLRSLSGTLTLLELRLSNQWMCEGGDVLAPIGELASLRRLHTSRLRDGDAKTLKALERLTVLEDLFFEGSNELFIGDESGSPQPPESKLDLSRPNCLRRVAFVETTFCAVSAVRERGFWSLFGGLSQNPGWV